MVMNEREQAKMASLERTVEKLKGPAPATPTDIERMDTINMANVAAEELIKSMTAMYPEKEKSKVLIRLYREQFECTVRRYIDY